MARTKQNSIMRSEDQSVALPPFPFTVRLNDEIPESGLISGLSPLQLYTAVEGQIQMPQGELSIKLFGIDGYFSLGLFDHWEGFGVN